MCVCDWFCTAGNAATQEQETKKKNKTHTANGEVKMIIHEVLDGYNWLDAKRKTEKLKMTSENHKYPIMIRLPCFFASVWASLRQTSASDSSSSSYSLLVILLFFTFCSLYGWLCGIAHCEFGASTFFDVPSCNFTIWTQSQARRKRFMNFGVFLSLNLLLVPKV